MDTLVEKSKRNGPLEISALSMGGWMILKWILKSGVKTYCLEMFKDWTSRMWTGFRLLRLGPSTATVL